MSSIRWPTLVGLVAMCLATIQFQVVRADNNDQEKAEQVQKVAQSVASFQALAIQDYSEAISRYGAESSVAQFRRIDGFLWQEVSPEIGWGYFFSVSTSTFLPLENGRYLAAYYNPWSDLYLIVLWNLDGAGARITDVEILMGDVVRRGGEPPFGIAPLWLRLDTFKPMAVALAVTESTLAFESVFGAAEAAEDWRALVFPETERDPITARNRDGARLLLMQSLSNMAQFASVTHNEDARLTSLRAVASQGMALATEGEIDQVLEGATGTPADTAQQFRDVPPALFNRLRPVGFYLGADGGFLFLVPDERPGLVVSLMIRHDEGDAANGQDAWIERMDIISYARVYEYLVGPSGETDK